LRTVRAAVSGTFFLAACAGPGTTDGGGTDGGAGATATAALIARLEGRCTDIVAADLGEGTLCADSGFRPGTDEFSFANWGRSTAADDNITVQTMIDLFGHSAVCMPGAESGCVVRPRTAQKLDEWNAAIANGRCEGMAALSQRLLLRYDLPSDFMPGAISASELRRDTPGLSRAIAHWWATQFLPEVADAARQSRARSPLQLVDDLIVGLENDVGHTVGMYSGGAGHSVTPFAVTKRGDSWVIHTYDNNHPGRRTEIIVSPGDEWSYAWGTGAGGTGTDWAGTTGTLELTPMSARNTQFACPFCDEPTADADTTVTVTSDDATRGLHVFLDAGDAGTLEVFGSSAVVGIDGRHVRQVADPHPPGRPHGDRLAAAVRHRPEDRAAHPRRGNRHQHILRARAACRPGRRPRERRRSDGPRRRDEGVASVAQSLRWRRESDRRTRGAGRRVGCR
jgi:hypothetical protein